MAASGPGTAGLDGHRHPDRRPVAALEAALRLLRRTVRPGDQPAAGRDPRGDRHLDGPRDGSRAEPARAHRRLVPPDPAALAGARQRRAQQDRPHQRRRRASGPENRCAARALRRRTRRRGTGRRDRGPAAPARRGDRQRRTDTGHLRPRLRPHQGAHPVAAGGRRPCTTTWCAPSSARRSRWSSRAATPARSTTSRCSSASAPPRSTRTWRSSRSRTSSARASSPASKPARRSATTSRRSARAS